MADRDTAPQAAGGPHPALLDPWEMALRWGEGVVMAVLTGTQGPAYRAPGAAMAIAADGRHAGTITSGCVEADLILRADEVRRSGRAQQLRYGRGSPFFDLRLPCGGGIDVRLFPLRDPDVLRHLSHAKRRRRALSLRLDAAGRLSLGDWQATGAEGEAFAIGFRPALRFAIFGTGAEAAAFAGLVRGAGYGHLVLSHEESSLVELRRAGSPVRLIHRQSQVGALRIDADTAVVLFYHDHDYEPPILRQVLRTPAFYIGAQGSRATQARRLQRLAEMGIPAEDLSRIRGPIGMIPSSREPITLAVSVLAEVIAAHAAPVR